MIMAMVYARLCVHMHLFNRTGAKYKRWHVHVVMTQVIVNRDSPSMGMGNMQSVPTGPKVLGLCDKISRSLLYQHMGPLVEFVCSQDSRASNPKCRGER